MAKGDKPDYVISAMTPGGGIKGKVGAGWTNPDGSIQVKLDPFVVLCAKDDLLIRMFPNEKVPTERASTTKPWDRNDLNDEIPF